MLIALKDSGYALDADDVGVLRTGLGMDADGKVDFAEFMSMCEDIASSQVRSTDFHRPTLMGTGKTDASQLKTPESIPSGSWRSDACTP